MGKDSFGARTTLAVGDKSYTIYALAALQRKGFDLTRLPLPMRTVLHPVAPRCDVGPHANPCEPLHQRVDIAVRAGQGADLTRQPISRQMLIAPDVAEDPRAELGVRVVRELAEVGYLAGFP